MAVIAGFPRLRFLMCQDTAADDDGFEALSRSQTLEYLWGRRCHNLRKPGFAALSTMPSLRGLSVSCKSVDDEGLSALPSFPALTEFMPMDVPDEGFRHIGACNRFEAIYCMYCKETTDVSTSHLSGLTRLKEYGAWSTGITDRSLELLSRLTSLQRMHLSYCAAISERGVAALSDLPNLQSITLEPISSVIGNAASAFSPVTRVNIMG